MPFALVFVHGRQVRSLIGQGVIEVVLDDDGFTRTRPGVGASTVLWPAALDVRRQYGLLVIGTAPGCVATVPEHAFDAEQPARVDRFIQRGRGASATHVPVSATGPTADTSA
ncbi:hypothetical protein [Embleya scabrispora]|uniref:hypothetical protein n=1 Tax=Embleya scabrispora TaxID=159449 RepID=UPI000C7A627D|nr:hypothetical protein [Embleya scabrispora]